MDGHAILLPGTGQLVGHTLLIHEAHLNVYIRIGLVVQPVQSTLSEERKTRDGKSNGVRDAGLAPAIAAGDSGGIAK